MEVHEPIIDITEAPVTTEIPQPTKATTPMDPIEPVEPLKPTTEAPKADDAVEPLKPITETPKPPKHLDVVELVMPTTEAPKPFKELEIIETDPEIIDEKEIRANVKVNETKDEKINVEDSLMEEEDELKKLEGEVENLPPLTDTERIVIHHIEEILEEVIETFEKLNNSKEIKVEDPLIEEEEFENLSNLTEAEDRKSSNTIIVEDVEEALEEVLEDIGEVPKTEEKPKESPLMTFFKNLLG